MAASFSNAFYTLPFSSSSSSSSSGASKAPQTLIHYCHFFLDKPIHSTSLTLAREYKHSPIIIKNTRRSLPRPALTPKDSAPQTNGDEASPSELENEADEKYSTSLKSLMQFYKVAILNGDVKAVSEIEVMMCRVEKEKAKLAERVSALSAEINSGKERYIRLQADFDNFRKRSEKEKSTIRGDAQAQVVENLLPIVDNFERAKQLIKVETEKEKKIDTSYQGIYKQFVEVMKSLQVTVVPTVGKPFDPLLHEAIAREESHEFQEGIITQEFRRGFKLGSRLLRPATVKVSSGPGKRKQSPVMQKSAGQTHGVDE
nr:protein GrpE [Ipomoea batatas]